MDSSPLGASNGYQATTLAGTVKRRREDGIPWRGAACWRYWVAWGYRVAHQGSRQEVYKFWSSSTLYGVAFSHLPVQNFPEGLAQKSVLPFWQKRYPVISNGFGAGR